MKHLFLFALLLAGQAVAAQSKLPVIKATSKKVSIYDNGELSTNTWTLSPQLRPDVFTADRTRETKWVVFHTDVDSIMVKVKPGTRFNFVVLLNGTDSCYTQIASAIPPEDKTQLATTKADTIPFKLTAFNSIAVQAVLDGRDTLTLHFDTGSWEFHFTQDAILNKTHLLPNRADVLAGAAKPNYRKLKPTARLQMGTMVFNEPPITATNLSAHEMDGRFGWTIFEGRQVEIDYDKQLLIIRPGESKAPKGYAKAKIHFLHSYVCLAGSFAIQDKIYPGEFLMDTGSDEALILDTDWTTQQNFPQNLKLLKTAVLHDPTGKAFEIKNVLAPAFQLNGFTLTQVPTAIFTRKNPAGFGVNYLGNDLLKRFNTILDFKHDYIYLKPNHLMSLPYRDNS